MDIKIKSDLFRYYGNTSIKTLIYSLFFNTGFRFSYFLRKCENNRNPFWRFFLWRMELKHHLHINPDTKIGHGLYIGYGEFVTITPKAIVGDNLNINHGAVVGLIGRGKRAGSPVIGKNVWIGTHAVVVGGIKIGDNVLIAPLSHVNFDVPDNAVVAGNPGKIISFLGTTGYVNNKWN